MRSIVSLVKTSNITRKSIAECGMINWEANAPFEIRDILNRHSDAINSPHIGKWTNYMWPAYQMNVAAAQDGGARE